MGIGESQLLQDSKSGRGDDSQGNRGSGIWIRVSKPRKFISGDKIMCQNTPLRWTATDFGPAGDLCVCGPRRNPPTPTANVHVAYVTIVNSS